MTAWKGIQELPTDDPKSFWVLGGLHGQPFRGGGWGSSSYWGGYCHHGNVLFPLWHRIYNLKVEEALQSIEGCEDVILPYWDELAASVPTVIPTCLTDEKFTYKTPQANPDLQTINNPLASYTFPLPIRDFVNGDDPNYSKHFKYTTVRYPLSGLVGTPADVKNTEAHNSQFQDHEVRTAQLNKNVKDWLDNTVVIDGQPIQTGTKARFENCLKAPNYTVFSNTTSSAQYNSQIVEGDGKSPVVSLESPHNQIHLAVGGFDAPNTPGSESSPISGANGDMGENDTAGFDPIFYFHHNFIDYVFWLWQNNDATHTVEIIPKYPGTNSADSQGATPGVFPNAWLDLDTPLEPFKKSDGTCYLARDAISTEALGYTYEPGSLHSITVARSIQAPINPSEYQMVEVSGINRNNIAGSFVISLFGKVGDQDHVHLGSEAVLSRWSVSSCMNCLNHVESQAYFSIPKTVSFDKSLRGAPEPEVTLNLRKTRLQKQTVVNAGSSLVPMSEKIRELGSPAFSVRIISGTAPSASSSSSSK